MAVVPSCLHTHWKLSDRSVTMLGRSRRVNPFAASLLVVHPIHCLLWVHSHSAMCWSVSSCTVHADQRVSISGLGSGSCARYFVYSMGDSCLVLELEHSIVREERVMLLERAQ